MSWNQIGMWNWSSQKPKDDIITINQRGNHEGQRSTPQGGVFPEIGREMRLCLNTRSERSAMGDTPSECGVNQQHYIQTIDDKSHHEIIMNLDRHRVSEKVIYPFRLPREWIKIKTKKKNEFNNMQTLQSTRKGLTPASMSHEFRAKEQIKNQLYSYSHDYWGYVLRRTNSEEWFQQ